MPTLTLVPLTPERAADYLDFFDRRAFTDNPKWAGCYCYFPIHDPAKIDWHARTGPQNRASVATCIADGQTSGVLALLDGQVMGWCHAGPWSMYPMLREVPVRDAETLGVIFCFVVAPASRGQGIATALLAAACDHLRALGMTAVQAKPLKAAKSAAANHLGPLSMYLKAGFEIVGPGPDDDVYVRKSLV